MPAKRPVAAQERHGPQENLALELQERDEHGGGLGDGDVVARVNVHQLAKEAGVDLLAHKGLGDPDAVDGLGQGGGEAAPGLLHAAQAVTEAAAIAPVHDPNRGQEEEHEGKELGVVPRHERAGDRHLQPLNDGHEGDVLNADAHVVDVRRQAANNAPELGLVEERQRERGELAEQLGAEVVDDGFTQFQRQALAKMKRAGGEKGQPQESGGVERDPGGVAARDGAVDGRADHPGQGGQLEAAQEGEGEEGVALAGVGPGIAQEAADQGEPQWGAVRLAIVQGMKEGDRFPLVEGREVRAGWGGPVGRVGPG